MNRKIVSVVLAMAMALLASAEGARAEYRVSVGDVVSFSVVGISELTVEASVDSEGHIHLPLAGSVPAAGKTIVELNEFVSRLLDGQPYRYVSGGTEGIVTVAAQDVRISMATYRPVVVYGAVGNPGEIPFRPGMTVRHALAIAGGLQAAAGEGLTGMQSATLVGEINVLKVRRKHLRATAQRFEALLARLNRDASSTGPTASDEADTELSERQRWLLASQFSAIESEEAHMVRSIEQLDERLALLRERERAETAAAAADAEDWERIKKLQNRGIVTMDRVSDVRRAELLSATRLLQTQDAIARAELARIELKRDLGRIRTDRAIELTKELDDTQTESAQLDSRIAALRQQLYLLTGTATEPSEGNISVVLMHRQVDDALPETQTASLADLLEPGDILEVVFRSEDEGESAAHETAFPLSDGRLARP